ncbi:hypothetical protein FOVSG1_000896 [Fusarium oxysporum f. sp. vasinfectum]
MPEIVRWSCHARCLSPRTYRLPSHRSSVISINGGDSVEAGLVTACQTWTRTGFCYLEFLLIGQCTSTFETEPPWFKPTPMWFLTMPNRAVKAGIVLFTSCFGRLILNSGVCIPYSSARNRPGESSCAMLMFATFLKEHME